jgi:hypothetical protein
MGRDKLEKRDSKGEKKDSEVGGEQNFAAGDQRRGGGLGGGGSGGRGLGRGRGGPRGGRGGRSDKENEEMRAGRPVNGPSRGGRGMGFGRGGRGGGRTFANRARGDREGDSYNTIDVWENSQADGAREAPPKIGKEMKRRISYHSMNVCVLKLMLIDYFRKLGQVPICGRLGQ